jgi:hypothetical protein
LVGAEIVGWGVSGSVVSDLLQPWTNNAPGITSDRRMATDDDLFMALFLRLGVETSKDTKTDSNIKFLLRPGGHEDTV